VNCVGYSVPNKGSTFLEILISAVRSAFSHSNHHNIKSIKELLWISFLKMCSSPYIIHGEAIDVQKQFLVICQDFNKMNSISGYVWS